MTHGKQRGQAAATGDISRQCVTLGEQCVMCGLCLPHCPTYMLKLNEAESPRGRISLIKALASAELAPEPEVVSHLESCLQCRRCETVCPAKVPFGQLMDSAKALLLQTCKASLKPFPRWLGWLVSSRRLRSFMALKLRFYQASGLRWLLQKSSVLKMLRLDRLDSLLSAASLTSPPIMRKKAAVSDRQIILFTGCVAEILDRETLLASKRLLEATGAAVNIPSQQGCCGALHQHAGDSHTAKRFILRNAAAFNGKPEAPTQPSPADLPAVISCASGCGAQLKEHESTLGIHHFDIHEYLHLHADRLEFAPLEHTVALHTPCTMDTGLGTSSAVSSMLHRIPGLKISPLPSAGCCGAAGAYMLTQPDTARRLLRQTLKKLAQINTDTLISSNTGCILHLRQGLASLGTDIRVMHPATLLARQLHSSM